MSHKTWFWIQKYLRLSIWSVVDSLIKHSLFSPILHSTKWAWASKLGIWFLWFFFLTKSTLGVVINSKMFSGFNQRQISCLSVLFKKRLLLKISKMVHSGFFPHRLRMYIAVIQSSFYIVDKRKKQIRLERPDSQDLTPSSSCLNILFHSSSCNL